MKKNKMKSGAVRTYARKGIRYLFHLEWYPVVLFKKPLLHWKPRRFPLLIRDFQCSPITHERIDTFFGDMPRLESVFRVYLRTGAEGWVVHNDKTWMGYTWSVDLSLRERDLFGRPRRFTYIGLPRDYPVEEPAWFGFSAEVNPRYQGKGVFFYLINHTWSHLQSCDPNAVIYSSVVPDNSPSIKTKLRMGEIPMGLYRAMDLRILGRHFSNIHCSTLNKDNIPHLELQGGLT